MQLARQPESGWTRYDLTDATEVLRWTYEEARTREVIVRVDLGSADAGLTGAGGAYLAVVFLNDVSVSPSNTVAVAAGDTRTVIVSRSVALNPGDVLSVEIAGLAGDAAVDVAASVRDVTPLTTTDVTGPGYIQVDHNYGGTNNLAYQTAAGGGIVGATVLAYLQADYDAGLRGSANIIARTYTTFGGRWLQPLALQPEVYTIVCQLVGRWGPDTRVVTVTA